MLDESGIGAIHYASKPGELQWPLKANDWAGTYDLPDGWVRVETAQRGDVVAIGRNSGSGHVGIVTGANQAVSAGQFSVNQNNYFWRPSAQTGANGDPVFIRYVGN